jgi:hypothetical protein
MNDIIKIRNNIVFIKNLFLYTGQKNISTSCKVVLCKAIFNGIGRQYPYHLLLSDIIELQLGENTYKRISINAFMHTLQAIIEKVERYACIIQTRVRNHLAKKHVALLRLQPEHLFNTVYGAKRRSICSITTFHKFQ